MREVKRLLDPARRAQPRRAAHRRPRLPPAPPEVDADVEAEVDRCVECGYCEPVCPSKDLTTTPRQRIVLRREMAARASARATTRCSPRAARRLRVRRGRDLRRRRHVPDRLPGADQHRRPGPAAARASSTGAVEQRGRGGAAARHWGATTRGAALRPDRGAGRARPLPAAATRRRPRACSAPTRPAVDAGPAARRRPSAGPRRRRRRWRSTSRPASAPCSARRTAAPASQHAFLTLCERAGVEAARARRHRRPVLRHAVEVQGPHRRLRGDARPGRRRRCGRRPTRARCRWSSTPRPAPRACPSCSPATRASRVVDAVDFVDATVLPPLTVRPHGRRRSPSTRPARRTRAGLNQALLARLAAAAAEEWSCPTTGSAAPSPATAGCCTPS